MDRVAVPVTNLWSGYTLLRSMNRIEALVAHLADAGFGQVALTDCDSMAGVEQFDRVARAHGLHPWLGLTSRMTLAGASREIRLLAKNQAGFRAILGWRRNPALSLPDDVVVVLGDASSAWWEDLLEPLTEAWPGGVVVELRMDQKSYISRWQGWDWHWVPAGRFRYPKTEDKLAYEVLCRIGDAEPEAGAAPWPLTVTSWMEPYLGFAAESLWQPEPPPPVLPDSGFKLPRTEGDSDQEMVRLREESFEGARRRYPMVDFEERLNYELSIIADLGFAGYFLMVADLVHHARSVGIRVGPGRGSAAGSIVSYALGITDVDPLKYDLLFERFLNPARRQMPDIDLDFDYERRYELIDYLRSRWGDDRVAQIGTYGTLGARAALRDVGRMMGIQTEAVTTVIRSLGLISGSRLRDQESEAKALLARLALPWSWYEVSGQLEGLPRHRSIHAAGVVIAPYPLADAIPCLDEGGHLVTEMEMASVERLGFLKLDVLGLRTLTILNRIEALAGLPADSITEVDGRDPETLALLARGDTDGVFQLDGRGVKDLLRQMVPASLEEVMMVVALYRPGPMEAIPTFLARRAGHQRKPEDPLARLCHDTYGVMIYQEQLMRAVEELAGFSLAEADLFRRAISKKDHEAMADQGDRFHRSLLARHYPPEEAGQLWQRIQAFADYGFNKSHAASYGILSYYLAYLKAHAPLAFWCAELSSLVSTEKLETEMVQAVAQGIAIAPPDVNQSQVDFSLAPGGLRAGLRLVRGIGEEASARVVDLREAEGPFKDYPDFERRVVSSLGVRVAESLARAGALDSLGSLPHFGAAQMNFFDAMESKDRAPIRDFVDGVGFPWPVAEGPIYVRLVPERPLSEVAQAVIQVLRRYPGEGLVYLIRKDGRGQRVPGQMRDDFEAISALKRVPGVQAAGRGVSHLER